MTYRNRYKKDLSWAEIIGSGVAIIGIVLFAVALGAILMIPVAWIGHWILVNLFNYTALSLWQVWGILIGIRIAFGGLVTVNKND
jgi:hypothetical protein